MPDIYKKLGLMPLINAAGTYTAVGGSRMSPNTLAKMNEAAASFINIRELQAAVGKRLAEITRNEAAAVCNGAASGLYIACAACISLLYKKPYPYLSKEHIEKAEIIVFRAHRNPYDWGLRLMGVQIKELGFPNIIQAVSEDELHASINERTAAVFLAHSAPKGWIADGELSLENTIAIARKYKVPVIVDAAAQLPPVENLWEITKKGADAVFFSGGKDLRGPQSSGLVVGTKTFVDMFNRMNFPNYGPGRMLKTGREEIIGLLNAVEEYLAMDHEAKALWFEAQVKKLADAFRDSPLFRFERSFPNEAGQPIPRAELIPTGFSEPLEVIVQHLLDSQPSVYTVLERGRLFVNPCCLEEGETEVIIDLLKKIK